MQSTPPLDRNSTSTDRPARARRAESHALRSFDAVVCGASAGGVEVLGILLAGLPADFAAAVMIVVHVPTGTPSYLPQTFGSRSVLPVIEPDAGEQIRAGRIYVAPPGYHMLVEADRTIALSTEAPIRFSRPSIDVLFESAAWVYRERLLGVLLSGANNDGARGLQAVRARGGLAWAQTPATAVSQEMPRAAIAAGAADAVLSPRTMVQRLARMPRHDYKTS
jgi:two-component system, chemotaxis family, protein-glutamate methylesterase/glutaminase